MEPELLPLCFWKCFFRYDFKRKLRLQIGQGNYTSQLTKILMEPELPLCFWRCCFRYDFKLKLRLQIGHGNCFKFQ